ncbi:hypothetical protein BaRGS_00003547, partial [Batillaria attramentaria]
GRVPGPPGCGTDMAVRQDEARESHKTSYYRLEDESPLWMPSTNTDITIHSHYNAMCNEPTQRSE